MIISEDKSEELKKAAAPLIKFINDNCHPHVKAIVETDRVELLEGVALEITHEFIKD